MALHNVPEWLMSQQADFPSGGGRAWYIDTIGFLLSWGATVPTDDATGYAKSGFFFHTDASGATDAVYINIGDIDACNFDSYESTLTSAQTSTITAVESNLKVVSDTLTSNIRHLTTERSDTDNLETVLQHR